MSNSIEKRMAALFERTGNLLERGVPLIKSLETLAAEFSTPDKEMLEAIIGLIRTGDTLAQSLERMKFLPDELLERIRHSENAGNLDVVLKDVAGQIATGTYRIEEPQDVPLLLELINTQYHDVLKQVNRLIIKAAQSGASDLHLEPGENGGRVRFRIDGVLKEQSENLQPDQFRGIVGRIKEMAALDPGEHRLPQDGRIMLRMSDEASDDDSDKKRFDLRVSVCPYIYGEKVVIRYLLRSSFPQSFEHIRVSADKIKTLRKWLGAPYGMILVSGPTGSGKTTTLYLLLKELSQRESINVISIEDPVEYILPDVYQMQINPKIGLTFPGALRSAMRQDPDVISVGEIRNPETATLLAEAAQTGHLTLSQLHSHNATATLRLMHDLGVPVHVLKETVIGVISQRLIRRLCPECKVPITDIDRRSMPDVLKIFEGPIHRAAGCEACHHTGYRGRDVIMELLEPDLSFWELLKAEEPVTSGDAVSIMPAYCALRDDALNRVMEGVTSFEEIQRVLSL